MVCVCVCVSLVSDKEKLSNLKLYFLINRLEDLIQFNCLDQLFSLRIFVRYGIGESLNLV